VNVTCDDSVLRLQKGAREGLELQGKFRRGGGHLWHSCVCGQGLGSLMASGSAWAPPASATPTAYSYSSARSAAAVCPHRSPAPTPDRSVPPPPAGQGTPPRLLRRAPSLAPLCRRPAPAPTTTTRYRMYRSHPRGPRRSRAHQLARPSGSLPSAPSHRRPPLLAVVRAVCTRPCRRCLVPRAPPTPPTPVPPPASPSSMYVYV